MSTENQTPTGAPPAGTGNQPPVKDAATLQAEIDALRAQVEEKQQAAEFWQKKASAAPAAAPTKPAASEEDDLDVLDAIASKGARGFDEIANKRGFIRKDEVEKLIDAKASNIAREQQLLKQYPDLGKKDSDFFKATAQYYGEGDSGVGRSGDRPRPGSPGRLPWERTGHGDSGADADLRSGAWPFGPPQRSEVAVCRGRLPASNSGAENMLKDFILWLFSDPQGHFALACIALTVCALAWLGLTLAGNTPAALEAKGAAGAFAVVVMTKLRS